MAYKTDVNIKERADEKITQEAIEFIQELRGRVVKDDNDRQEWKHKLISAANQRLGIKRISNYPYENAPDIPLPQTDKLIKKQTPSLVLSAWSIKNMCNVHLDGIRKDPEIEKAVKRSEIATNYILREKMDLFDKLEMAADFAKEKGHCIFKIVEEFKSRKVHKILDVEEYDDEVISQLKSLRNEELRMFLAERYYLDIDDEKDQEVLDSIIDQFRSGKTIIEFDIDEISSLPNIEVPLPSSVIVPSYTTDISQAERITHEFFLTPHELEDRMRTGAYIKKELKDITKSSDDDILTNQKNQAEGVTQSNPDLYRIHEVYTWYKPEGAECHERWVFTFLADVMAHEESLLRMIPFPFEFDSWNFERFDNERKDPRHYNSRGVPEQIRALQEIMERAINNSLIRDEYNNTPIYEVLETSDILQRSGSFVPGEFVPVANLGSEIRRIDERAVPDVSSNNIMQVAKAFVEEYQASSDQLFRNATNIGGGKTLGEIERGMQMNQGPLTVEVVRWNETLNRVYTKVYLILRERLGDSIWIEGQEVSREDFQFPVTVKSNGSLEVSDANTATQKAWMRLQAAVSMMPYNVANVEDLYNSYREWLEKDGVKDPDDYSTHPQEIMQSQLAQLQQQIQQAQAQLQQMGQEAQNKQKMVEKAKKMFSDETNRFEGRMEAISEPR
jgi:hypothetical protein